jgi:aspartyl-tRNA(Asn)/glutamyl-tRNA(Gln) amidotransferase subunit A
MSYNAFITETDIRESDDGPLAGQRVAIKDNISTAGTRTTCGSAMLESYVPPYDATVIKRLKQAGAHIVGKTNMDEFGMGGTTETSAFGATKNPVDETRVPGGSSGGSAAAVAAGKADIALGSDTGGSVRNPAAFCGVVGLKPTYGLVSRYGLVAYANSLEQIGPIGQSVSDVAALLDIVAGVDHNDATTRYDAHHDGATHPGKNTEYQAAVGNSASSLTIGVIRELVEGATTGVTEQFNAALETLRSVGVDIVDVSLSSLEHAVQAYYVIAMSEASSNLARFDGVRYGPETAENGNWNETFADVRERGFGEEVKRRILLGTFALSAGYQDKYYTKAQDARAWVAQDFDEAFERADLLATPTMPVTPPPIGESLDNPLQLYLMDANTVPVNLADLPAISVPAGKHDGLPVGLQLIGPQFSEETLLAAAGTVESLSN